MSDELVQLVSHSSIKREDELNDRLNSLKAEGVTVACHRSCLSSYTSQHLLRYILENVSR